MQRRRQWPGVDYQIHIAVLARISPRKGAEKTHTLNAMSGRDGQKFRKLSGPNPRSVMFTILRICSRLTRQTR